MENNPSFDQIGQRIRRLREAKDLSRREFAEILKVNVSSVAGWETGKRLPRPKQRRGVARALGANADFLFNETEDGDAPITAVVIDTLERLPDLLTELTRRCQRLRALRLSAPYGTPAHIQVEWRNLVDTRIRNGSLIEIFYDLRRLQETLANIFRYDGLPYHVKSYCAGLSEVAPTFGGYFFDDTEFVLGGYWTGVPPREQAGLRLSGAPFRRFFHDYWSEIWRRGTLLNIRGSHDLAAVNRLACSLGLKARDWERFVTEAKDLRIGDGAPPLI